jgi:hypothetical protein
VEVSVGAPAVKVVAPKPAITDTPKPAATATPRPATTDPKRKAASTVGSTKKPAHKIARNARKTHAKKKKSAVIPSSNLHEKKKPLTP